jgi:NF-kappa-B inhibitor-like protein 2
LYPFLGNLHIVELLLDRGANVTVKTDLGESVLDVLEKWHKSVKLEPSDEIFYDTIRERIFSSLDKVVGICTNKKVTSPLTSTAVPKSIASSSAQRPSHIDDMLVDLYPTPSNSTTSSTANRPSGSKSKAPEIGRMRHSLTYSDSESDEYGSVSTTKSINLDESSEELVSVFPVRSPLKNPSLTKKQKTNACSEYKNVMQGLRNRYTETGENDDDVTMSKRRTGHLNRQEVGESWLEDDLGPNKKRQKFITDTVFEMHGTSHSKSTPIKRLSNPLNEVVLSTEKKKSKENSVPPSAAHDYSSVISIDELFNEDSVDAFDMMMINEANSVDRSKRRRSSTSKTSSSSGAQSRQQTSLLDAGFARFRSESPLLEQVSNVGLIRHKSFNRHLPDSTSNVAGFFNLVEQSPQKTTALSVPMSVKVKVEDQLLLVPINSTSVNDLTIGWLAEETARRYYK